MNLITKPSVYLVGKQQVVDAELGRFLADHGVEWKSDGGSGAEVLAETGGRVCFDEETEILTNQGWKRFADLDRTEMVMTLNPESYSLEWQAPDAYQTYDYNGLLKSVDGRDISFSVTPEHRQFATFDWDSGQDKGHIFVSTAEIGNRRCCLVSAGRGWVGEVPDSVVIPEVCFTQATNNQFGSGYGVATKTRPAICIAGRSRVFALAQLLVYYATEGSERKQSGSGQGIVIYGDHVEEVTRLCKVLGLKYGVYTDKRNGVPRVLISGGKRWSRFFSENCGTGSVNKRLPQWVLELPAPELTEVWNLLVRTDGHIYPSGREVLVTCSTALAGQAQEILCKIGASSAMRPMSGGTNHQMYMVSRKKGRPIHLNNKIKIVDRMYTGKVYCVTTENSVVYVRRDGKVHFSGNCYMSFEKPRPGGNRAYMDHIKDVGHGSVLEHGVWNLIVTGVSRSLSHELVRHRIGLSPSQLSQRYVDESVAEFVVPPDLQIEVEALQYHRAVLWGPYGEKPRMTREEAAAIWPAASLLENADNESFHAAVGAGMIWEQSVKTSQQAYVKLSDYLTQKVKKRAYESYFDRVTDGRDHFPMTFEQWTTSKTPENDKTAQRKFARQAARSVLPNATETKLKLTVNARAARNIFEQRASRFADPEIRVLAHEMWKVLVADSPNLFSDYQETSLPDGTMELVTKWRKV